MDAHKTSTSSARLTLSLFMLLAALGVSTLGCGGSTQGPTTSGESSVNWSGDWQTNFGPVSMRTDQGPGARVYGSYAYDLNGRLVRGTFEGDAQGADLLVVWTDEPGGSGSGRAHFTMAPDGRSFRGTWGRGQSETDGGEWSGAR